MPLAVASIGLLGGGTNSWKVTFDKNKSTLTIGYGTMFYNGKFFTVTDLESGSVTEAFVDNVIFGKDATLQYIYLQIFNPMSLPDEDDEDLKIKIDIITSFDDPNKINKNAPMIEYIPLAYGDSEGNLTDLRPVFWNTNFSILA